ncbi:MULTISPECIES: shikimate dehydrogenase [unclassified Adlercreutzia]|uniref:shikimate dehydrogenase family protein n=1 Tax=unclassified Adlercreutzia TaxID=2636013 RepID=UPI0013EBCDB9|nr:MULTISPECIES: shikimate dehydrogenase [unclassified Adlercreutzia]
MSAQKNLYILGHPIAHSKSPAMYNAVYARLGLDWHYGFADLPTLEEAETFLRARDFLSVNVTTPYKPAAFEAADVRAASAQLARGANVLVNKGGTLIAYNVDGQGCVGYLERTGVRFAGKRVAVCGTGPTALAILHAAAQAGAAEVVLVGRDKERAAGVLRAYADAYRKLAEATVDLPAPQEHHLSFRAAYEHVSLKFGSYATSTQAIAAADVIIDATPLGMHAGDPAPFDTGLLSARQVVFDVVYGHGTTSLVTAARAAGCAAHDGAGMLVAQAVATFNIVCEVAGVDAVCGFDELFDVMANAAGFDGL